MLHLQPVHIFNYLYQLGSEFIQERTKTAQINIHYLQTYSNSNLCKCSSAMFLYFLFHVQVPTFDVRMFQKISKSITSFNTAQDTINGQIGQIRLVSS